MMLDQDVTAPSLLIRFFGPIEVSVRGNPLPHLRSRKGYWLLALLALRAGREVERTWLMGTLWPNSSEAAARASLRTSLKDLRHALGPEAGRLSSPTPRTLSLDLRDAEVDIIAFDSALARGDGPSLERAVRLYRGPLLEGCAEEWALPDRQAREQGYLRALEALAAHAHAGGEPAAAERYLRLAVAVDPLRESAQRELMQVLAARGSYAAALQTYRDLRLRLHREVNAAPDPQTQALFAQIGAAAQRSRSSAPSVGAPLHPVSNLPAPPTLLLGRECELKTVQEMLDGEAVRLLTLTGTGGTGKTRLALEAAALRGDFRDGVFFVNLAPVRDPGLVTSSIAQTLAVRESPRQSLLASLKEYLRDKEMLLLLDNFEHLLPAAPLVAELLAAAPRLKILVTSRAALRLRGERLFSVSPLALPPLVAPSYSSATTTSWSSALRQYAAVRLFIQRALDVRPGFFVTDENTPAIAEICRRLDGLPLAIELAAARIRLFSPEALLSRLESRLELLVGGPRDLPARQQTLRDTIAWSYDQLDASERQLFRRLSIFVGGCTLQAAETITTISRARAKSPPGADLVAGLTSLLDQSLLRQEEGQDGQPRFSMLETVREFAAECLTESGEWEHLRTQHAANFLQLAEQAETELRGADAPIWVARLEADLDNLRAALTGAVETGDAETGLRLSGALAPFWRMRGRWAEALQWFDQSLALAGSAAFGRERAKAMAGQALITRVKMHGAPGECPSARALYEQSLSISRDCGDRLCTARTLEALGDLAREEGRIEEAHSCYEESLALYRELDDRRGEAALLKSMGLMGVEARDWEQAKALLEQSRATYQELSDSWGVAGPAVGLSTLAAVYEHDLPKARRYAEECLAIYRRLGAPEGTAMSLGQLAEIAMGQGEHEEAQALLRESLEIARDLDDHRSIANVLSVQGELAFRQGDLRTARSRHEESLSVCRAQRFTWALASELSHLGDVAHRQADIAAAQSYYTEALITRWDLLHEAEVNAVNRRFNAQSGIAQCLDGLARVVAAVGRSEHAARLLGAADGRRDAIGAPLSPAECAERDRQLASVRAALGEVVFAAACAQGRAMTLAQAVNCALGIAASGA